MSTASDVSNDVLPEDAVAASAWLVYPSYDQASNPTPDVGLVFLEEAITGIAPMAVLRTSEDAHLRAGQGIEVVGWGLRTPGGPDDGRKFGALVDLQVVTDQLLIYGAPLAGATAVNKCHGDSGGPSFLDVDGVVRVVGISSRSDCETFTLDVRADAFASFFDQEMRARCQDGSRVACDIPGLPTAAELEPLVNPRQVPPALADLLVEAGARFAQCFEVEADEGVVVLYRSAFALGASTCSAEDLDAGLAYYQCLTTAPCNDYFQDHACPSERVAIEDAIVCTDLEHPGNVADMDPPLREAVEAYCGAIITCNLSDSALADCMQVMANQLAWTLECARMELLFADSYSCASGAACADLEKYDPNGCFVGVTQEAIDEAADNCVVDGAGEGEGEGEGEKRDDDEDDDKGIFGCSSSGGSTGLWSFASLGLIVRRRRV